MKSVLKEELRHLYEWLQTIRREFPGKHEIRMSGVGYPQLLNEAGRHLSRGVGVGVAAHAAGPINPGQSVAGAPIRILHRQKRRKIMLLRVARVQVVAGKLKLPPQSPLPHHHHRMLPGQAEELRPAPEPLERHLRQHYVFPPSNVPIFIIHSLIHTYIIIN